MGVQCCMGASMMCSFGAAPSTLVVLPTNKVLATTPAANIMDHKPIVNIPPFGMCMSPSNPTVAVATAAALGVLTPMPCVPATASPWIVGSPTILIGNMPTLDSNSKLMCSWGGVIQFVTPGQFKVMTK
ncbi:MAG: DUF4280 domain-containing protein [Polyangia bacterium]